MEHLIARLLAGNIQHLFVVACVIAVIAVFGRALNRALPTVAGKAMAKPKAALLLVALGVGFFLFKDKLIHVDPVQAEANDRAELTALQHDIDEMHHWGVAGEPENYRRQYSYNHMDKKYVYHRDCDECDHNYETRKRMDAIYRRHKAWTPGMFPPPPLPEPHK